MSDDVYLGDDPYVTYGEIAKVEERTHSLVFRLGVLIVLGMIIQLIVIGYVVYSQYEGRKDSVTNLRAGCERGKKDRRDNARIARADADNWHQAALVRRKDGDIDVATVYEGNSLRQLLSAESLTERSKINCAQAFPKASVLR